MSSQFCPGFVPTAPSLSQFSGHSLKLAPKPCGNLTSIPARSRRCFLPRFSMSGGGDHSTADSSINDEHPVDAQNESVAQHHPNLEHENQDQDSDGVPTMVQGPSQAPTKAGVSTAGMSENEAAFITACYDADVSSIEAALDKGQDVNVTDVNRRSALHFCAGNGLPTLCTRLIELGADIDARDMLGLTPLHMATGYKKVDTVKLLVDTGADANIASMNGELAVEIAERMFEKTPEKKFFMKNDDHTRLKEIVEILDEATEVEDEDEEETEDMVEEKGGSKFVVRVKPKGEAQPERPPDPPASDVKVTIRMKEPKK